MKLILFFRDLLGPRTNSFRLPLKSVKNDVQYYDALSIQENGLRATFIGCICPWIVKYVSFALVAVHAITNHVANTAPNPTPVEGRYHTEELFIFRIAPQVFEVEQPIIWILAILEIATILHLNGIIPIPSSVKVVICPAPDPDIRLTVPFVVGIILLLLSTFILLLCYRILGRHFTYYLTICDKHELITSGPYSLVRHPSYGGTLLLVASVPLSHVTSGSWLTECGFAKPSGMALVASWILWWIWTFTVCVRRAQAEDAQLRKQFGKQWDDYATKVAWWFVPGLL